MSTSEFPGDASPYLKESRRVEAKILAGCRWLLERVGLGRPSEPADGPRGAG